MGTATRGNASLGSASATRGIEWLTPRTGVATKGNGEALGHPAMALHSTAAVCRSGRMRRLCGARWRFAQVQQRSVEPRHSTARRRTVAAESPMAMRWQGSTALVSATARVCTAQMSEPCSVSVAARREHGYARRGAGSVWHRVAAERRGHVRRWRWSALHRRRKAPRCTAPALHRYAKATHRVARPDR